MTSAHEGSGEPISSVSVGGHASSAGVRSEARGEARQGIGSRPPIKVLLVEDNAKDAYVLRKALADAHGAGATGTGFEVLWAERLQEALRHLSESQFDVGLLDLSLPDSSGLDTLATIYARHPQLPILILSEQGDEELAVQAAQRGAQDFLTKGVSHDGLLVRSILFAIERKRIESEHALLLEREIAERTFLEDVLRQMVRGVMIAEAPSGKLVLGSEQVEQIWRHPFVPSASIEEYAAYRGFHADGTPFAPQDWPLARSIRTGEIVIDEEITFMRGDGTMGIMSMSSAPVRDRAGHITSAVATFYDAARRKKMEVALHDSQERLKRLAHRLLLAQEEERRYIARELHDQVGQALTVVKLNLQAAQSTPGASLIASHLEESLAVLGNTLQQVRDLSFALRPPILDDLGLVSALRWDLDRLAQSSGLQVRFVANGLDIGSGPRLPSDLETACFRIVREALTNVVRHAQAQQVDVALRRHDSVLELVVQDDGVGFDVQAALQQSVHGASLGLIGMQERVGLMNGHMAIESAPVPGHGKLTHRSTLGTRILARFPLVGGRHPDAGGAYGADATVDEEDVDSVGGFG